MLLVESLDAYLDLVRWGQLAEADEKAEVAKLVKLAAGGDQQALGDLYTKFLPSLMRAAKSRGRGLSDSDIEDAVQDTVMRTLLKPSYLKQFASNPGRLVKAMGGAAINAVIDLQRKKGKPVHALQPGDAGGAGPGSTGVLTKFGGRRLKTDELKTVQSALAAAMKGLDASKRNLIRALMFDKSGNMRSPTHGELQKIADKFAPKGTKNAKNWASQTKRRFLQSLCTNQELCDLLRGRARGSAKYICKGVKDSCAEAIEQLIGLDSLLEDSASEDDAMDLVLRWLGEL
jgi:DNA-directed RNA polymerase specialized sigma24 family protein